MKRKIILLIIFILFSFGFSQENKPKKINKINIIGNQSLAEGQIRPLLRIYDAKILSKMDYDRRLVKLDAINIKTFYVSQGFLGVNVKDSIDIIENRVDVYFLIQEGKRYYINSVNISGNKVMTQAAIQEILGLKLQEPYNPVSTNVNFHLLEDRYREIGKLFSTIKISDSIADSVDLSINIIEGPDVTINDSFIRGLGSLDSVLVQRDLSFKKGDKYNQSDIIESQRKLLQSGLFSVANITPVKFAQNDTLVNLLIELRKFKRHEWISEGGFYPIDFYDRNDAEPGAGLLTGWRDRSIFNSATSLSIKLSGQALISNSSLNPKLRFDIVLANPWLYKIKIPTKAQLYIESFKDYLSEGLPYVTRYGLELVNTYYLDKVERRSYIESRLYLDRFSREDLSNIEQDLINNVIITPSKIKIEKHSFQLNFRLDKSNNILYPSKGFMYLAQLNSTGGILGGNRDYIKLDFGIRGYRAIYKNIILAGRIKYGMMKGWDENNQDYLYDKFYLGGGTSLRGWDILRYLEDADGRPAGDIVRLLTNWEIRFPLFWYLGGEVFLDGGHIYDSNKNISINQFSWDSGFGLTLATPLGPVRLDFAHRLESNTEWKIQLGVQYIF